MGNKTYKNEDELKSIVRSLATNVDAKQMCHMRFGSEPLPQQGAIKQIIMLCRGLLFPDSSATRMSIAIIWSTISG